MCLAPLIPLVKLVAYQKNDVKTNDEFPFSVQYEFDFYALDKFKLSNLLYFILFHFSYNFFYA